MCRRPCRSIRAVTRRRSGTSRGGGRPLRPGRHGRSLGHGRDREIRGGIGRTIRRPATTLDRFVRDMGWPRAPVRAERIHPDPGTSQQSQHRVDLFPVNLLHLLQRNRCHRVVVDAARRLPPTGAEQIHGQEAVADLVLRPDDWLRGRVSFIALRRYPSTMGPPSRSPSGPIACIAPSVPRHSR